MIFRILELCLSVIALIFTIQQVVLPMIKNETIFPMFKNLLKDKDQTK